MNPAGPEGGNSADVASCLAVMWTAVMTARIRPAPIRHAPAPAPVGSLDVFVTVCGELAEIAKATPRAAMVIDYPHRGRQPGHHRAQRAPFGP